MTCCDCRRGVDDVSALLSGADELLNLVGRSEATCSMLGSGVLRGLLGAFGVASPGGCDRPSEGLRHRWCAAQAFGNGVAQGLRRDALAQSGQQIRMARVRRVASGSAHQQARLPSQRRALRDLWCLLWCIWSRRKRRRRRIRRRGTARRCRLSATSTLWHYFWHAASTLGHCVGQATRILGHHPSSLMASVLLTQRSPPGLLGALLSARCPRVVLRPIMDFVSALLTVQEPHRQQRSDESPVVAWPINRQLKVLGRHAGEVAVATVGRCPEEQVQAT